MAKDYGRYITLGQQVGVCLSIDELGEWSLLGLSSLSSFLFSGCFRASFGVVRGMLGGGLMTVR